MLSSTPKHMFYYTRRRNVTNCLACNILLFNNCLLVYIWASSRENLSSVFPTKLDSNQSPQLHRLARKLKFHL